MKRLTVTLPGHSYDILIAPGLLLQAGERIRAVCPQAGPLYHPMWVWMCIMLTMTKLMPANE